MPAFDLSLFILGVLGGAAPDVIRIIKARYRRKWPPYLGNGNFWLGFGLLVLLGGLAAWLFSAQDAKTALAMGFTAPEVFSRLASKPKDVDRGGEERFNLREWWSR